jgi:hypothetical protein
MAYDGIDLTVYVQGAAERMGIDADESAAALLDYLFRHECLLGPRSRSSGRRRHAEPGEGRGYCEGPLIAESRDLTTSLAYLLTISLPYFAAPVHLF